MERDMLGILDCAYAVFAYLVSTTFGLPLTLFIFSFNFFHMMPTPGAAFGSVAFRLEKRGFPLFSLYFYCTVYRIVLFIVLCCVVCFTECVPP